MFSYPVTLTPAEEGGYIVTFPDIPEAVTQGEDKEEALLWALDALETMLDAYMADRQRIPYPSPVKKGMPYVVLPVIVAAKVILYNTMLESGKKKADLARMLNMSPTLIDRLLSLRHKSRIEQIETALAVFGKKLVLDVV